MHSALMDALCCNSLGVSKEMRQGSVVTVTDYSNDINVHSPPLKFSERQARTTCFV